MAARFWIGCAVFHAVMLTVSARVGLRWQRRLVPGAPRTGWLRAVLADAGVWAGCAVFLALLAALFGSNGFTAVRLLSQALFGELLALTAWTAALLWRRGHRPTAAAAALACTTLLATYAEAYHREPTDLHVRRYAVDASHGSVSGRVRIVQLSDIQADRAGPYEERALRTAAAERPDLVVLTGDYVQPRIDGARPDATAALNRLLRDVRLEAPLGVFAVRGDVDLDWPRVFDGTAVRTLSGEVASVPLPGGRALSLIGLTTRMSHGRDPDGVASLVGRSAADSLRIAIGHGPDFVRDLAAAGRVDLALAGHTHGGQVVLPWLGAPYIKSRLPRLYASGLHDFGGVPLHVSAGIGMERGTAPQLRFLCPPELSVIEVTY